MKPCDTPAESLAALSGHQIRAGRALLGISQPTLAAVAGVARQTVSTIEAQREVPPGSGSVIAAAFADLGVEFVPGGVVLAGQREPATS